MENNNRQGCRWDGELKNILVVCDHDENYQIWSKYKYEKYIRGCVEVGGGSAYRIVTHFNGNESLLTDQPESIEPCATSSENYWKQRCEAAEAYAYIAFSKITGVMSGDEEKLFNEWQQFKTENNL